MQCFLVTGFSGKVPSFIRSVCIYVYKTINNEWGEKGKEIND